MSTSPLLLPVRDPIAPSPPGRHPVQGRRWTVPPAKGPGWALHLLAGALGALAVDLVDTQQAQSAAQQVAAQEPPGASCAPSAERPSAVPFAGTASAFAAGSFIAPWACGGTSGRPEPPCPGSRRPSACAVLACEGGELLAFARARQPAVLR